VQFSGQQTALFKLETRPAGHEHYVCGAKVMKSYLHWVQVVFDAEQTLHLGSLQSLGGTVLFVSIRTVVVVPGALQVSYFLRASHWLFSVSDKSLKRL
jgi:hypothetical protein